MAIRPTPVFLLRFGVAVLCALICFSYTPAQAISSPSFQIKEDFLGGSGSPNGSSPGFQEQDSLGGSVVGDSAGTAYKTQSGATTTSDPTLSFSVSTGSVSMGSLSTSLTRTGTATFSVLNYTSYGYIVQTLGNPPDNGNHTLANMSSAASSATNTEQFGVNLVANTSPAVFGADPLQVPGGFGFGAAASGYSTTNTYKYNAGDTIATATKSSGKTTYTISYIINIANATPGGSYSGRQTLICIGTY